MPKPLKLVFLLLFVVICFLSNPSFARASCSYPGDADYPACAQGVAMGSGSTICKDSNGIGYACCSNKPVADTCPPLNSLTPTPTINPSGNCGHNSEHCCPGGTCLDPGSSCYNPGYPGTYPICITQAQKCLIPGMNCGATAPTFHGNDDAFCDSSYGSVKTAIGCVPISSISALVTALLRWSFGIAGGIAFILIIIAGFQLATSSGDPKRAKAAQELITAAITGLILIVLAVIVLNFVGVKILGINSLGFNF